MYSGLKSLIWQFLTLVHSKWLWCQPMKSTKGEECVSTLKSIFQDMKVLPECIVCDRG